MSDEAGLEKCAANYVPLTPLSHLNRAKTVFPETEALVYGTRRYTYTQYHARVSQLASALHQRGIKPGDVVATLIPNLPAQAEAHFGVPRPLRHPVPAAGRSRQRGLHRRRPRDHRGGRRAKRFPRHRAFPRI